MNLNDLTPDQRRALKEQLKAEEKAEKEKLKADKEAYKALQDEFVSQFFPKLVKIAEDLTLSKAELFEAARTILDFKNNVYGLGEEQLAQQQSYTISSSDFSKSIILGHNVVDGWDAEVANAGVSRVTEWLGKQTNDGNRVLVGMIRDLLKPNKEGILKAPRVLELMNQAEKIDDQELIDAVNLIREAYRPVKTTTFVRAKFKDEDGKNMFLNLSMSQA